MVILVVVLVIDESINGKAGYDTVWKINGNIGGNILVTDRSTGTSGGIHSSEWYLSSPNGNIGGNVEFIEKSKRGESFDYSKYNLGNVNGNALFQSVNDVKYNHLMYHHLLFKVLVVIFHF